jgi:DNA-binding response OmpR family regulator
MADTATPIDVVYVEDDPRIRMMYRLNLEADGCIVREAENGEEALALVEARVPDILLADIFMPRMDGIELAEQVRQRVDAQPAIVFLSANPMSVDEDMLRLLGDDYLRKPFPPTALVPHLREVLRRKAEMASPA